MKKYFYSLILLPIVISMTCADLNAQLPPDFSEETITNALNRPVGIAFDPNGQAYVWEHRGPIYIIDTTDQLLETPLLDISEEITAFGDHGLLGFALDPDFLENGYFYIMYVVDRHHLLYYGTPMYEPDSTITNAATIGRITRYTADAANNFQSILPDSRKVLLGESIDTGIPILITSHGVGSLFFGTDGTLLASVGEAGSFLSDDYGSDPISYYQQALDDGIIQPHENVGSFRSQLVDNLNGKILRLDPATGDGVASNPYFDPEAPRAPRSRVYALGLRNPFRCTLRPGTGSHDPAEGYPGDIYIGDVGGDKWEELSVCDAPGMNFGWPMYEGILKKPGFWGTHKDHPTALNPNYGINGCTQQYYTFQELLQQPEEDGNNIFQDPCNDNLTIDPSLTYVHDLPVFSYANKLSNKPARTHFPIYNEAGEVDTLNITDPSSPITAAPFSGYTSIAGLFYDGTNFPEEYRGKYFHADYSWWIKTMDFDANNELQDIKDFHTSSDYVLSMAVHPKSGCLYYINFVTKVHRICYGGNNPPVATATYDTQYGPAPHLVQFTGAESYDPEGTELDFFWDFGDGTTSEEKNPSHTFLATDGLPRRFDVTLEVTDSLGASSQANLVISVNNTPPMVDINSFKDSAQYSIRAFSVWPLSAQVEDLEEAAENLNYRWRSVLKHNTHEHPNPIDDQAATQTIIEPLGCSPTENYWYEIQLDVEDSYGLIGRDTSSLFPYCDDPFFQLEYFDGVANQQQVDLSWSAIEEADVDYYLLQRITSSTGLQTLARLDAHGANLAYLNADGSPVLGVNNYRLKIYRADGTFEFSPEVRVIFPPAPALLVYPNPTDAACIFEVDEVAGEIKVELYDMQGRLVLVDQKNTEKFEISLAGLPDGVYTYRLTNGDAINKGQIIKAADKE